MSAGGSQRERRGKALTAEQRALVEEAMPMVARTARGLALWRTDADVGELLSAGGEALVRTAAAYDPARNDRFEGYAWERVYRAMGDQLAAGRPAAEVALMRAQQAGIALAATLRDGTRPLADGRDEVEQQVVLACDEVALAFAFGLDHATTWAAGEDGMIALVEMRRRLAAVRRELSRLPETDRRLFELRYLQQMSYRKIAATLGISRSKATRRARELLAEVRKALGVPGGARARATAATALAADPDP
jgi:RNA polymerase sigma factor (sigma-70 family)